MTQKLSASIKLDDGAILTVGGETVTEFLLNLSELGLDAEVVKERYSALLGVGAGVMATAVAAAAPLLGAAPAAQPTGSWQQPQSPYPANSTPAAGKMAEPPGPPKTCAHGERRWASGVKDGNAWGGWMCPTPKEWVPQQGDPPKCRPEWYSTR